MPDPDKAIWPPFVWTAVVLALTAGFGLGGLLFAAPMLGLPVHLAPGQDGQHDRHRMKVDG